MSGKKIVKVILLDLHPEEVADAGILQEGTGSGYDRYQSADELGYMDL